MGQAKRRGTFEQRVANAIERNNQRAKRISMQYEHIRAEAAKRKKLSSVHTAINIIYENNKTSYS